MQGARGFLSCASCRQRKLKCDRKEPCGNCATRGVDCVYATVLRSRNSAHTRHGNQHLSARIRQLEHLVGTSVAPGSPIQDAVDPSNIQELGFAVESREQVASDQAQSNDIEVKPGHMISNSGQVVYVSGIHWAAICNEVASIREHIDRDHSAEPLDFPGQIQHEGGPMLLEGTHPSSDLAAVLCEIPPRDVADRLVSRYINSNEPSAVIIHKPTFGQEYARFWLEPHNFSAPWLSLLFGIMSMGVFFYVRSQDDLPNGLGSPRNAMDVFQRCSTECLIISKYSTIPTAHTMEALLLNIQNEYVRRRDAHLGVWVLCGIATRLAMRMGYHRDPEHYSQISTFNGEMRRRVWAIILQLDALTSCQLGLPSMIQESQCDTQLPHNLIDEDFDADTMRLPPSRPHTELTPVSYTIAKAQLLSVFRTIFNEVCLGRVEGYEEIMALDKRLLAVQSSIPPRFRMTSSEASVTTPSHLLIRRYNIELLFQKARCFLHRHHMTKAYQDPKFSYSRSSCIDAAMSILSHQMNIFKEVHPGGLLYRDKWFISSLEQHDFLLASMIVCLELGSRGSEGYAPSSSYDRNLGNYRSEELIEALKNSRQFWAEFKASSTEAQFGLDLISAMLQRVCTSQESQESSLEDFQSLGDLQNPIFSYDPSFLQEEISPQNSYLEGIEAMLATPNNVDWGLWETFLQRSRTASDSQLSHAVRFNKLRAVT
ncbi:transcriptional regulator family: Fungal Specific TF [Penicillium roqueforti]|nr:transcriptional regulator family: Fungal Specific TF [Penicillium roqueforti]KAI3273899.1 transcriptional regulator family: Fungal Specific TF [Penicillium roqueforti]KAI3292314.1 transcriptional regulator family: Fungal Specific TF [Penicillium roqueforti]KAI3296737.1 transcriptional regulator family: Fungal Specific TF [Penicillium roqueforti]